MSMNEFFAQYYNTLGETTKTAGAEDLEKQAQYELFAKIANANGIDLTKLSDEQVDTLFAETFKTAGEVPPQFAAKDAEEHEKKEEAKKEHEEKKEAAARFVQADSFGRQAAHAYVDELKKIAEATQDKTAGAAERLANLGHRAGKHVENVGRHIAGKATGAGKEGVHGMSPRTAKGIGAGAYAAGGAAAAAGGAAAHHHMKNKKASALDELAANRAVALVDEYNKTAGANYDLQEAADRVSAVVFTLGLNDSVKVASVPDLDSAVEVRALEALEAAGYPVNWQ